MNIGLCECPIGLLKRPCKHKHVLAKHFKLPSFNTIPTESCEMRAIYDFLGTGQREDPTWYRPLQLPDEPADSSVIIQTHAIHDESTDVLDLPTLPIVVDPDEEYTNKTKSLFKESMSNLLNVLDDRFNNDPENYAKSMVAFTRQCDTLLLGSDAKIQKALHTFTKESIKAVERGRKKNSGTIPVQSKSTSRQKFLIRGRGSSVIKGHPTKDVPQASTQVNDVV